MVGFLSPLEIDSEAAASAIYKDHVLAGCRAMGYLKI